MVIRPDEGGVGHGARPAAFVFLHGGPGFCGAADRAILGDELRARGRACGFWDEPSIRRPTGDPFEPERAYERWLASAERFTLAVAHASPVCLLVHSFTAQAGLELARRHPERVRGLVAIAPVADPWEGYSAVLRLAARHFDTIGDGRGAEVRAHLLATKAVMDEPMQQGFALAAQDARLFDAYWVDPAAQRRAGAAFGDQAGIDVESFFAVLFDFRDRHHVLHTARPISQPVLGVFGDKDPIAPSVTQLPALRAVVPHADAVTVASTAHYPHLEAPGQVIDAIERWMRESFADPLDAAGRDA